VVNVRYQDRGRDPRVRPCRLQPCGRQPFALGDGNMARDLRRDSRPGLYCVELRTENWERMLRWYREVLGLRVLVRVVDDGYALIEAGDTRLAIISRKSAQPATRRVSLAFEVRDVPALCAELRDAGSPVTHPKRDPEGLREAETADPDGNRIRLFMWPDNRQPGETQLRG
jgi:predicted enzyme related to lactoylglutathione lyase